MPQRPARLRCAECGLLSCTEHPDAPGIHLAHGHIVAYHYLRHQVGLGVRGRALEEWIEREGGETTTSNPYWRGANKRHLREALSYARRWQPSDWYEGRLPEKAKGAPGLFGPVRKEAEDW